MYNLAVIMAVFVAAIAREALAFVDASDNEHGHSQDWIDNLEDNF